MTKMDAVLRRIGELTPARQDEIAEVLTQIVDLEKDAADAPAWQIEELKRRLAEPDDFADDDEVEAFFARRED